MKDLVDIMGGGRGSMPREDDRATKSDLHDFEMVLHYDTGKAVLVSDTGEEKRAVFLPKSQIEIHKQDKTSPAVKRDGQRTVLPVVTITVPEWLAKDKGLI
jgi:hypothetical protein